MDSFSRLTTTENNYIYVLMQIGNFYIFAIDPDGDELTSVDPVNKDAVFAAVWHVGEDEITRDGSGRITSWDPDTQILSWNAEGKMSVAKDSTEEMPDGVISFMESEDWPEPYVGK